ncbi:MAG: FAD-dependent oxidoreductase [Gordonia sp. (in: high G+C Gram-positive bacteria)]
MSSTEFTPRDAPTLAVVGGGVIGLTCALAASDAGWRVRVHDAGPQHRAAEVAGGMLGCFGEGHPGEDRLLAESADSVARWPSLLERLDDASIATASDTLLVAGSAADLRHLDVVADFVRAQRPDAALAPVSASDLRRSEPAFVRSLAGGYRSDGEGAVDNRRLLAALRRTLAEAGAEFVDAQVGDVSDVDGDQVLLAAGLDTPALCPGELDELRGEKGEILRLRRTSWSVAPPKHVIRARWHGRTVYLVPRDGGVVIGATQYEAIDPDDRAPQAGGVADLLADACELMPGLRTYELAEASAGIRPSTADGLPVVRRLDERVVVATGHGRNGIALAPGTAHRVAGLLAEVRPANIEEIV